MSVRVRIALAASVLVALLLLTAAAVAIQRILRPRELEVVRTLDDLRATRPIRLPGGRHAWVGLSATRVARNEHVVLYALVHGEPPPRPCRPGLGPFTLRTARRALERVSRSTPLVRPGDDVLFVTSMRPEQDGAEDVTLLLGAEVVATARILVGPEIAAPFLDLAAAQSSIDDGHLGAHCIAPTPFLSLAHVDDVVTSPPPLDLPRPFDEPRLALAVEGEDVVITSTRADLAVDPVDSRLAARWWINDRPVSTEGASCKSVAFSGQVILARTVRLHLHLDRRALHARRGDRIGMQLLYLGGPLPRLTNRVDFVLRADPRSELRAE